MLSADLEGRILSLLGKWVVDLGMSRQDFAFAEQFCSGAEVKFYSQISVFQVYIFSCNV